MFISEVVQCYTQINIKQYNKNNIIMQSFQDIKNRSWAVAITDYTLLDSYSDLTIM
jgi:hypothetical protein